MTILLGLVFCIINPLVPAMCVVYFLVAHLIDKYSLLYMERPSYQSGGQLWKHVFEQIIVGLLWFQVIMVALLGIKQSYAAILVSLELPLASLALSDCSPWYCQKADHLLSSIQRKAVCAVFCCLLLLGELAGCKQIAFAKSCT